MDKSSNDYLINFLQPTTDCARKNRNMILHFVIVWAVAGINGLVDVFSDLFVRITKQLKYYTITNP